MHVVKFLDALTIGRGLQIGPGLFLADNTNAGYWLSKWSNRVQVRGCPELDGWNPQSRRICVVRPGGLGDLIMLTPIFRHIKEQAPDARLTVSTYPWNAPVLRGLSYVDETCDYPLPAARWGEFDAIVALDDLMEFDPQPEKTHALDAMLRAFPGIDLRISHRKPEYALGRDEVVAALSTWKAPATADGGLVVGVQLQASAKCRTYPLMPELIRRLIDRGHGLRIFGEPGRRHVEHDFGDQLHDLASGTVGGRAPDFRESVALASDCDVLIAPDSSMVHVAGALEIPCVALYGSFAAVTRVRDYPSVYAIQGRAPCAPCCWHSRTGHWPKKPGAQCLTADHCTALASIPPQRVVTIAERIARTKITNGGKP